MYSVYNIRDNTKQNVYVVNTGATGAASETSFVGCKVYIAGSGNVIYSSGNSIQFNTIKYEYPGSNFNVTTYAYTIPTTGIYQFIIRVALVSTATNAASVGLFKNDDTANPIVRNGKFGANIEILTTCAECIAGEIHCQSSNRSNHYRNCPTLDRVHNN